MFDELFDFSSAILHGHALASGGTLEFALHVMQVYEAALLSAGEPVAISDIDVSAPN
jgi:hypothetical protein